MPPVPAPEALVGPPPATDLDGISITADLKPLPVGDRRYVDLTRGHHSRALLLVLQNLEKIAKAPRPTQAEDYAKILITGHRGCGKSTELNRLRVKVEDSFSVVNLVLDESFLTDFDHTLLLLSIAEGLTDAFADRGMPLDPRLVENVARWFATETQTDVSQQSLDTRFATQAEVEAKWSLAGIGLKMLARVTGEIRGSLDRRTEVKRVLQRRSSELIDRVNLLLVEAERVLERNGLQPRLLIVYDNLDRLFKEAARTLFIETGDQLKQIRAHCIFTAPVTQKIAPYTMAIRFPQYPIPMIKVQDRDNQSVEEGLTALAELLAHRAAPTLFDGPDTIRHLCAMSGGSVRDLVRLLGSATDNAAVDGKAVIDRKSVDYAVKEMRISYQQALIPERVYFPRLARIHLTKRDGFTGDENLPPDRQDLERDHFATLLFIGAILQYNGDENWYDVHPVIRDIEEFKDALAEIRARTGPGDAA